MRNSISLSVGDSVHLKTGKDHIIYAGMPSENVYSIVQKKDEGYRGYSWNLFYPKSRTSLTIDKVNLTIESVTHEEIRLHVG